MGSEPALLACHYERGDVIKNIDIENACADFARGHNSEEHEESVVGVQVCRHFGAWVDQLSQNGNLAVDVPAYLTDKSATVDPAIAEVSRLLARANVPASWPLVIEALSVSTERREVIFAAVDALYGVVSDRLRVPTNSREDVLPIMYVVEAVMALEAWAIQDADANNYVPMGDTKYWWPYYITAMDEFVTVEDLAELSRTAGRITETEGLSSVTPPERLVEICEQSFGIAQANPNLPADYVNAHLAQWELLFHPNADPEKSWAEIEQALAAGEGEDLANVMIEFNDMKDDGWVAFAGFATNGPHAELLRSRMREWCENNLEDDEKEEMLSILNLDDDNWDEGDEE